MIKVIAIGKIKETFFQEAIKEYEKRLSKYTKLEIVELPDHNTDSVDVTLNKEKQSILNHIKEKDYVITLCLEGKKLDSQDFAITLEKIFNYNSNITFIIGGSYGLHQEIKTRSDLKLSFSDLTFPHQLFRVILLEQIYRCYKIMNHETYHK